MKRIGYLLSVAGIFLLCCAPASVSAHVTGASWEQSVGNYTADVGYDPTTFTARQYTRFDFNLWIGTTTTDANGITSGTPQKFAQVWVRILNKDTNSTLLATGIWSQPIGPTTLLYNFQEPGSYTLEASYRDADGADIAVASFPVAVTSGDSAQGLSIDAGLLILGVVLGVLGTYLPSKVRSARRS